MAKKQPAGTDKNSGKASAKAKPKAKPKASGKKKSGKRPETAKDPNKKPRQHHKPNTKTVVRTRFSRHIQHDKPYIITEGGDHLPAGDIIAKDIELYNRMKHTAFAWGLKSTTKTDPKPDPKAGGTDAGKKGEPSIQKRIKAAFHVNDYFANSAVQEAKALQKSRDELIEYNTGVWNGNIEEMQEKCSRLESSMTRLKGIKDQLIARSREIKHGTSKEEATKKLTCLKAGAYERLNNDGTVSVGFGKKVTVYDDLYCFESQYVTPRIKQLKHDLNQIRQKITHFETKIRKQKRSCCFGSAALARKQGTTMKVHDEWRNAWENRRYSQMQITGRYDLTQGNAVFKYDIGKHELIYTSMRGFDVHIPDVVFPLGQDDIERSVSAGEDIKAKKADAWSKEPVTWTIRVTGGSFLILATIHMPESRKNFDCSTGIIGLDKNPDNFGLAELDQHGNILNRKTIRFDLKGKSSGEATQILSVKLDEVFEWCRKTHKPLAVESIQTIKKRLLYQKDKEISRQLSQFSYTKMETLIMSKSEKYGIGVIHVDPAYTSQIGKVKYMRRYGLAVHEAAAAVIGRRAMGFKDIVPKCLQSLVSESTRKKHTWKQWSSLYRTTSKISWRRMYKKPVKELSFAKKTEVAEYFTPSDDTQVPDAR
ncbi:MAG: IS200/IS605 family accessory protein TnpB-related protein [Lachnospiraceae bacterium]|nr:IS200/IS605 family accessory protein TnpB-related protein [Lachnospiraceae bacterium]